MAEARWLDAEAAQGPVFSLGADVFVRSHPGGRLLTLTARQPLSAAYLLALTPALTVLAEQWQAPLLLAISPALSAPPSPRLLGRWGMDIRRSGVVERTFLVLAGSPTLTAGRLACAAMRAAGLSIEAVDGESGLQARLSGVEIGAGWAGWSRTSQLPRR